VRTDLKSSLKTIVVPLAWFYIMLTLPDVVIIVQDCYEK